MHWNGWFGMGGMWLWWILLLVAAGLLIRWLIAAGAGPSTYSGSPTEILEERLARGEIDRDEYRRLLTELRA